MEDRCVHIVYIYMCIQKDSRPTRMRQCSGFQSLFLKIIVLGSLSPSQVLSPQESEDELIEQGLDRVPVSFGNDEQALEAAINDVAGKGERERVNEVESILSLAVMDSNQSIHRGRGRPEEYPFSFFF